MLYRLMLLIVFIATPFVAAAATLSDIQFITIAAKDSRAVIKGADGKLSVIKPGDSIADGVKVKEITTGRIVLEETKAEGTEMVFVKIAKGKTVIERVKQDAGKSVVSGLATVGPEISTRFDAPTYLKDCSRSTFFHLIECSLGRGYT